MHSTFLLLSSRLLRLSAQLRVWTCGMLLVAVNAHESVAQATAAAAEARRPLNVLFIVVDDLNTWISPYRGHPQAATPHLDRLASRSTIFLNAHCQAPLCGPSRASFWSGFYPHTTGVYQQPRGNLLAEDREFFRGHLLPEYLVRHGYQTFGVGKLTHGYPAEVAFQTFGGWRGGYGPKPSNNQRFHFTPPGAPFSSTQTDWGAYPERDADMPDYQHASWAVDVLQQEHAAPFFLAVGMVRPHVPFYVPQKWFDQFPLADIQLPEVREEDQNDIPEIAVRIHELPNYPDLAWLRGEDDEQFRRCVQAYLACVAFVDEQIGRVLTALDASPQRDQTIVVLLSDHGYHLGEKNRVAKHSLWEESTRVPLMISLPRQQATQINSLPVGLIDLYPTLLDLCGLPENPRNEGLSLAPILRGEELPDWRIAILTTYARGNHSLRTEDLRLTRYEDGEFELYDHRFDPQEFNNLAGPAQFDRQAMLRNWEIAQALSTLLPETEAPYHPATNPTPVNLWFQEHFETQGVQPPAAAPESVPSQR